MLRVSSIGEAMGFFHSLACPYITVTNIAREHFWQSGREYYEIGEFEMAPLFDVYAMEYKVPAMLITENQRQVAMPPVLRGAICRVFFTRMDVRGGAQGWYHQEMEPEARVLFPTPQWEMLASLFLLDKKGVPLVFHQWLFFLEETGYVMRRQERSALFTLAGQEVADKVLIPYLNCCGLGHHFIHSVNVALQPAGLYQPRAVLPRGGDRPETKPWRVTYHRVVISPQSAGGPEGAERGLQSAREVRMHTRRGHFREYGPKYNKGLLFGKIEGRFYIESHIAGDLTAGAIISDYEVREND